MLTAWETNKLFLKCKTAYDGMDHTLKLTYGDDGIDVSAFLVTRDVRGTVYNGMCQAYPPREKFYKCQNWAAKGVSFNDPIDFPSSGSDSSFRSDDDGPNSCHAQGWISKIGEYKGELDFCPYSKDDGSAPSAFSKVGSAPSVCSKDISSCTQMCKSFWKNNADGLKICNDFAQQRCDFCYSFADLNLPSNSYYHE